MARLVLAVGLLAVFCSLYQNVEGKRQLLELRLADLLKRPRDIGLLTKIRDRRLSGGSGVNACDYPGVVAVTFRQRIMCGGLHQAGSIVVPNDCAEFLEYVTRLGAVDVYGDDGTVTGTVDSYSATDNGDGTSTIPLTSTFSTTNCATSDYTAYDAVTMTVDTATCEIVSYGGLTTKGHSYDANLQSAPLEVNPLHGCCADVIPNLSSYALLGTVETNANYYTCSKTSQGICNGDIGAPIYCTDSVSGNKVVAGMVATGKCDSAGETFVSIDLTGGSLTGFSA